MGEYADLSLEGAWSLDGYDECYATRQRPKQKKKKRKNPAFYPRRVFPWPKGKKLIPDLCRRNKEDDTWLMYVARPPWDRG